MIHRQSLQIINSTIQSNNENKNALMWKKPQMHSVRALKVIHLQKSLITFLFLLISQDSRTRPYSTSYENHTDKFLKINCNQCLVKIKKKCYFGEI